MRAPVPSAVPDHPAGPHAQSQIQRRVRGCHSDRRVRLPVRFYMNLELGTGVDVVVLTTFGPMPRKPARSSELMNLQELGSATELVCAGLVFLGQLAAQF